MVNIARHWKPATLFATAPLVGAAFVYGGYWIPDLELRVLLSVPTIAALVTLIWLRVSRIDSPLPGPKLAAGATVAALWLALAAMPYLGRSVLLHLEAADLPAWKGKRPLFRFGVVGDNSVDYEGAQIARAPREEVEAFYRRKMADDGWKLERRFIATPGDVDYLIFAKGNRKIAFHLGRTWEDHATAVEIFRVSYWPGAHEPGTGRRAWHDMIRDAL
ncbi:MAG: hypothetical protein WBC44_14300 [Planctomycetaceae bacterium]